MTLIDNLRDLFTKHSDTLGNPFIREAIDKLTELRKRLSDAALCEVELREELANARKDAERYRWLRERHENTIIDIYSSIPAMTSPELLDAAIDAEMEKKL